jgi:lysophospholipase L1-like esterase
VWIATATAPEHWQFLELGPRTRARVEQALVRLNRATREVADAWGVACLEVAGHSGLGRDENFCADGLHPSALGHARAAHGFARLLRERHRLAITIEGGADEHDHA